MAARFTGQLPQGTDGTDWEHRQRIDSRYSVVTSAKLTLGRVSNVLAALIIVRVVGEVTGHFEGVEKLLLYLPAAATALGILLEKTALSRNSVPSLWAFVAVNFVSALYLIYEGVLPGPHAIGTTAGRFSFAMSVVWAVLSATACTGGIRVIRAVTKAGSANKRK